MEYRMESTEAILFVKDKLHISNPERHVQHDKSDLLDKICQSFLNYIPWHNVNLLNTPMEQREPPTIPESVQCITSGQGGLCWSMNCALFTVLKALGYDVTLALGSVGSRDSNNHVIIVVSNLREDNDRYLVDVGFGEPAFQAICLDFEKESDTLKESFRVYKLLKEDDTYIRVNTRRRDSQELHEPNQPESWEEKYYFRMENHDVSALYELLAESVWRNHKCMFHRSIWCVLFPENKLVAIKDNVLLMENSDGNVVSTTLDTDEAILSAIGQYFPMIPGKMAAIAVAEWSSASQEEELSV